MQSFGLNYHVKSDLIEEFKETLSELFKEMEASEGHIESTLFADVNEPNSMMIYSNWKTKAEFSEFIRSGTFTEALQKAVSMLETEPEHFMGENVRLLKNPD
jgi:heme-degrading monooxygenase HmoA